jgi:hypothetical protein
MKKVIRLFLLGAAVIVGLMLVAAGIAFLPGFQTWAAHRLLAAHPAWRVDLGRIDAGLDHLRLEQVRLVESGATITLPLVEAELPVLAATRQSIQIKKLVAKGWTIDLTQPLAPATAASGEPETREGPPHSPEFSLLASAYGADATPVAAAVFQGVFTQLKLPIDLSVDSLELEGEIIFQVAPGQAPVRARVTLTGGQLGAGREGRFTFNANAALAATAPVNALNATGTFTAAMDTARTFSQLGAQIDATARGPQFPEGARLALGLTASHANAGENYTIVIESSGRKLAAVQAAYPAAPGLAAATRALDGSWMLDVSDADVAPFVLGRPLAAFTAKGAGKFETDATFSDVSASGHLEANAAKLGTIREELAALGAMKIATDFDLVQSGKSVRVTSFTAEIAGAQPVIAVRALQPFEFNAATGELKVAEPSKDLLSLDLQDVPLAWAQPFIKRFNFSGNDLRASFVVGARSGGFAVRPVGPLTIDNLSVSQAAKPLVRAADISLQASADYTPQGWQAEFAGVTVRSGGAALLTLSGRAGQLAGKDQPVKIAGQWAANLPAMLAQPLAADYAMLTGGSASGDFAASLGAKRELQFKVAFTGLAADPSLVPTGLPAVSADIRADIDKEGRITFNAPLLLERDGRKSDLALAGTLTPTPAGLVVDGHLTSNFFAVEDGQILAAPLAGKAVPAVPPTRAPGNAATRDKAPVWSGVSGQLVLELKKVVYQQKFEVGDLGGAVRIESGMLKLDAIHASLGEGSDFKLGGTVTFDAANKEPYALKSDFALTNFNTVPLFQAFDPGKPATIEGKFNVTGQLAGTGLNLAQLAERTRGDFQLTSKGGTCRLLQADISDKLQKTQTTVAALGGLLGAMTGQEKIADYANRTKIVVDVADDWKEIPFDQLNVAIKRDDDLNVMLQDFSLISPTKRIVGTGEIKYAEGTPLLGQALDLRLQLGARGKTADLMNRANLLNGQQDNLGYTGFVAPIHIGGTLENPDTSEFRSALLKAAGGSLLNNLLGR